MSNAQKCDCVGWGDTCPHTPTERDLEHKAIMLMERMGGGFASALAKAWLRADDNNLRKLRSAFPELLSDYKEMVKAGHGG